MSSLGNITDTDFQATVASGLILVDFWAPWCGPCKALTPHLEALAEAMPEVRIVKMNVDESQETAAMLGVMNIPALKLFRDGKLLATRTGSATPAQLREFLEANKG